MYCFLNFSILLLPWDYILGEVGRRELDAHVLVSGTETGRAAAQEIPLDSQKSPGAKYWLLLEDCYFYLMMWVSILHKNRPLKPSHNVNHLFLLSKKITAVVPCLCPPSAVQSSSVSVKSHNSIISLVITFSDILHCLYWKERPSQSAKIRDDMAVGLINV